MSKTFEDVMKFTAGVSSSTALDDSEARALYDACIQVPRGGLVIEVGCEFGRSSSVIGQMAQEGGFRTVHIDPYTEHPEYLPIWMRMMRMVSSEFAFLCMKTEEAGWHLERLSRDGVDFAFLDGDHDYEGITTDLRIVAGRIRPGGLLACHDYRRDSLPDVSRAISKYMENGLWEEVGTFGTLGVWRKK